MSSQGASSASTHEEGPTFTCFLRLPVELQIQVWEYAFPSSPGPRIACLQVQSAPSTRLSHEVLNLNNMDAHIGWRILNLTYLAETDSVSSLLETSHRSRTITLRRVQRTLDTPWLRRLGLSGAHVDPETDIICFGNPTDHDGMHPFMTGMSLVMGNEFPNVIVPTRPFLRHVVQHLVRGVVDPVGKALEVLRAADPVWDQIFRPEGGGPLPSSCLPKNIYYFMSVPRRAPCCAHGRSFCLHYEHLKISTWSDRVAWATSYTSDDKSEGMRLRMVRLALMNGIRIFWDHVRTLPGFADRIPNIFLVEIKE